MLRRMGIKTQDKFLHILLEKSSRFRCGNLIEILRRNCGSLFLTGF